MTRIQDLQDWWIRSQQWTAIRGDALPMLDEVQSQQIYFYRGNAWSNAQSTGDFEAGENEMLPTGVRLVLTLPAGLLTRDLLVRPSQ